MFINDNDTECTLRVESTNTFTFTQIHSQHGHHTLSLESGYEDIGPAPWTPDIQDNLIFLDMSGI